ncbi:hypothetical protein EAO27_17340 [Sphingopyxis sp. YF1]|jgi:hypothetical protein|uniref:hypothetical protein n=1 Tax=Sphingopyxis sp. YF1 TaxID=2482763 RepID=UPI001F61A128|nr:hypothetical protein [Sphingopyxis sp. YF1]UNU44273.1 hypothetical protein EAO27_17340 [Sphingopyxis sp. YF1]HZG32434.1 hypothetical protein [Sphingopyxis sp.]
MRKLNWMILAVVPLLAGAPAIASDSAGSTEAAKANPKDRMVCKRTQQTGTRFKKEVCKTAGQWDAIAEQHRRDLSETVDRPQVEIRRE